MSTPAASSYGFVNATERLKHDAKLHLSAENLGMHYGSRLLFRRLTVQVSAGSVLGITGANGSGKSTLIRILAGVLTPSAGLVQLFSDGRTYQASAIGPHVGLVAPYLNLYEALTVRENLKFLARIRGRKSIDKAAVSAILDRVDLIDRADERIETFSSGMKQRACYAAACLFDPPVLLLDEPGSNLDDAGKRIVAGIIDTWREAGRIVVVATNEATESDACDAVLRIEDFR